MVLCGKQHHRRQPQQQSLPPLHPLPRPLRWTAAMRLRSDAALLRRWVSGWGVGGCWRLEGADASSVADGDNKDDAARLTANAFARLTPDI